MPPPGLFGRLIQNKRRLLWEKREGVDATLIVADVKFGVHSMILGAESPILQSRFQASLRKSGLREIIIEEADIHTVWRTLMLIYLGYYSTSPCPKVATSDEANELALHGSVYNLAVSWGLPNNLQEIIFQNYKNTVENTWQPLAFLESVNIIFSLLGESGTVHGHGMSIITSDWSDPDRLREDRIAQLVVQQLETRRESFEDDSSITLCRSLQNSPVLLRLFLQRWLVSPAQAPKCTCQA
ncbi:hypothetical protein V8F44DRAFT_488950 [Aspergillus fumigatus]